MFINMPTKLSARFNKTLLVAIFSALLPSIAAAESLLELYTLALANDHNLKNQQALFEESRDIVNIERSATLPQINGQASYETSNTEASYNQDSSADALGFTISLEQSLLSFRNRHLIERGKIDEQVAALQLASAEQSLVLRTAEAYFNVLNAFEQLRSAQTEQDVIAKRLEQVQERFDVGLIPINDVLEAQADLDTALADTLAADANLGIERENLASITGRYTQTIAPLQAGFIAPAPLPNNRTAWIEQALKGSLNLKISALEIEAANASYKATRHNDSLSIDGSASYNRAQDLQSDGSSNTTSLGVTLSVPLYAGGRYSAQKRQSAQQVIQAQERLRLAQRETVRDARSLFLSLKSSQALLKARQQVIASSQSALEASQAGYDAGIRDIIDVINAQTNAFQAQRNYSTALYQYLVDSLSLKATAGLLSIADLESLDNVLDKSAPLRLGDFSVVN